MSELTNIKREPYKLHFATGDIGNIHVVGRWAQLFQLLASKDIDGDQMNLGMTMLSSLRGRHVHNFAGAAFNHNEAVLAEGGALHRISSGSTGIDALEGVFMLQVGEL